MTQPRTGSDRRGEAMALLEARRSIYLTRCQRATVSMLLATTANTISADDIRSKVDLPAEVDARLIGAAIRGLSRAGIIRPVGITTSTRPERHAGILRTWELQDRAAAVQWLRENPNVADRILESNEKSSTVAPAEPKQLTLFAGEQEHGNAV